MLEFPRNYRFFTDLPAIAMLRHLQAGKLKLLLKRYKVKPRNVFKILKTELFLFLFLTSLISGLLFTADLLNNIQKEKELKVVKSELEKEVKLWQLAADKYKGNKQAYLELALIEYRLMNFDLAKYYLDKALFIDPNFKEAKNLQIILNSKF